MSLFKPLLGNSARLPEKLTDGWAYFCTDTGEFFIDFADENGNLHRKQINAEEAKRITNVTGVEGQFVGFDANGNAIVDKVSWNDLDERPFGEEHVYEPIIWDGSTSNRESWSLNSDIIYYKVSDTVLTISQLENSTIVFNNNNNLIIDTIQDDISNGGYIMVNSVYLPSLLIVIDADKFSNMIGTTLTNGTYFLYVISEGIYPIALFKSTINTIDLKYLPDSISTKEDVWIATNDYAVLPSKKYWSDITYGNGKFIAIEYDYEHPYSFDGINWNENSGWKSGVGDTWTAITYGDNKFVKIANNSSAVGYSIDGIQWNSHTLPSDNYWGDIAYGNGMFIATTYGDEIAYSTNCIDWTQITLPNSFCCKSITYGEDKFVISGSIDGVSSVAYSEDGINWNFATINADSAFGFSNIVYGNGKFVTIGRTPTPSCAYSMDGINWTTVSMPDMDCNDPYSLDYCLAYGDSKFVAIYSNSSNVSHAFYSLDGINWTLGNMPYNGAFKWSAITYGDDKFVVIAYNSDITAFSFDGITWQRELKQITQGNTDLTTDIIEILGVNNMTFDETPTEGSVNHVTSGGVFTALSDIQTELDNKQTTLTVTDDGDGNVVIS